MIRSIVRDTGGLLRGRALGRAAAGRRLLPSLLVAAGLAGCEGGQQAAGALPRPGNPAPEFSARTLEGDVVSLDEFRGNVVVLNVWATWCGPCVREMPGLQELHRRYADRGLVVLGASIDRGSSEGAVRRFLEEHGIGFTILLDPDQNVQQRFRTLGVPETFLIGRDGVIAHRWIGEFEPLAPEVIALVEEQLAREVP